MAKREGDETAVDEVPAKKDKPAGFVKGASADKVEALASALAADGVVRVEGLYTPQQIAEWSAYHRGLLTHVDDECLKKECMEMQYLSGLGEKAYHTQKFRKLDDDSLVLDLGPGRIDFTYGCDDGPFADAAFHAPPPIARLMGRLLKADFAHFAGAVPSRQKSDAGMWHRDTYSMFDDEEVDINLPPYYYTILVPLSDVTQDLGPTQFALGSHRLSHEQAKEMPLAVATMRAGDAVIFDGRTIHRGLENVTDALRPVMYIVWHKKWYNDYSDCYFKDGFHVGSGPEKS